MITPREQAMALRFAARRRLAGLTRGESGAYADLAAARERSVPIFVVLTVLALGVAAAYGFFAGAPPTTVPKDGVVRTEAGDYFVVIDGVAHPALNATSAMLADDEIIEVEAQALRGIARGAPVGISGAPDALPTTTTEASAWSLCLTPNESGRRLTVVATSSLPGLPTLSAMVLSDSDGVLWLVTAGRRHRVSADRLTALGISPSIAIDSPDQLLSLIPEATALDVAALGWQPDAVVQRVTPAGTTYFAVLAGTLAALTPLSAALLSNGPPGQATPDDGTATASAALPADWPTEIPQTLDLRTRAVCASWGEPRAGVLDQLPLTNASLVDEPTASSAVVMPRDKVAVIRVPGDPADSYVVLSDAGLAYAVADRAALGRLGYRPEQALDVPTAVLGLLPRGPELSIEAARATAVG
ncbi:type VII secretion protein EccB [Epidermidibacterium keratini]|uniref:Type VII secretion protein EccB n=1 Tax=Epidermidibacterium keratini TaxID=1891644 RepID=A0A7L4YR20_9ACTN|nr:type VII secretion protein EccB [Epidermidibacterium keratini]QHC01229.1 type VII secretion protein EccB [Epidermidibacterium keratini]